MRLRLLALRLRRTHLGLHLRLMLRNRLSLFGLRARAPRLVREGIRLYRGQRTTGLRWGGGPGLQRRCTLSWLLGTIQRRK